MIRNAHRILVDLANFAKKKYGLFEQCTIMRNNLSLIKRFYDAFRRHDENDCLQLCDEHIE